MTFGPALLLEGSDYPALAQRVEQAVRALRPGVADNDLARAALADLLAVPDQEFERVAARVLDKNRELYRRLA